MAQTVGTSSGGSSGGSRSSRRGSGGSFGPRSTQGTKSTAPASTQSYTPIQQSYSYSDSGSGGGGGSYDYGYGGGGGGGGYAAPVAPPRPTQDEFLAGDAGYKAQQAALKKALADYQANYNAELNQYEGDYKKGIHNLGYNMAVEDDPKTPDVNEAMAASWDLKDVNRSSGRAYQNQQNDFASRGMLKSSGYAEAINNLMRSLEEQRGSIDTARSNFRNEKERSFNTYKNENKSQNDLALAEAISRYAALYGV